MLVGLISCLCQFIYKANGAMEWSLQNKFKYIYIVIVTNLQSFKYAVRHWWLWIIFMRKTRQASRCLAWILHSFIIFPFCKWKVYIIVDCFHMVYAVRAPMRQLECIFICFVLCFFFHLLQSEQLAVEPCGDIGAECTLDDHHCRSNCSWSTGEHKQ